MTSTSEPDATRTPDDSGSIQQQVLPLVYIQTQQKLPFTSITKTNIVNSVPQLQFATIPQSTPQRPNQGVLLTPVKAVKPQLVLHKSPAVTTKFSGTYVTLKPFNKLSEACPSTVLQTPNPKLMIAPMPKVINNRLPVTVTTDSLQSKITFMPLSLPESSTTNTIYNFKIADGQVSEEGQEQECVETPRCEKEYELSIVEEKEECVVEKRKAKHGVSILKKGSYSRAVPPSTNPTPIPDPGIERNPVKPQKTERRRKSNFAYRKDYDDMEIIESRDEDKEPEEENVDNVELEMAVIQDSNVDINMNDECDFQKLLKWDEGIGSLPGSELKFIMNEFNLVEYVTKEEYDKIIEEKMAKIQNQANKDFEDELQCLTCRCFGQPTEFITREYCSLECQIKGSGKSREVKTKKTRKKTAKKVDGPKYDSAGSDEENTSNENSQDKFTYPWTCSKKGFSWTKYLEHMKVKAAPLKLFKDAFPYSKNGFRPGMRMEGIDPQHPSYFCVLSVAETCGYRLRLHFDGYPDNYDFWVNADSMDIFPVGWCEKHGHVLQTPPGYSTESFNWVTYLKQTKATAAPKHLFANRAGNAICPNGFRVGMKLEAVDRNDNSLVCVASVRDMMDNRILVHFDSWDDIYDYWADPTSPYIHPVGWCDQSGHRLTAPHDYPNPETFNWTKYLKETKSVAAPSRAFKQRQTCGFKRGMRLECVDKRVPQLIRVASVTDVRAHQIRIQFDGWLERYSYWIDDDNEDIHPVGWCQKTGHPIETPLTPEDVYDFLGCATVGCRGIGHTQGPRFETHGDQKFCPYAEENIDVDRILQDRLLSQDRLPEAIPISRDPAPKEKTKPRLGRPPKYPRPEAVPARPETESEDQKSVPQQVPLKSEVPKKPKRMYRKRSKVDPLERNDSKREKVESFIEEATIEPAFRESWANHTRFLNDLIEDNVDAGVWGTSQVLKFVRMVPGLEGYLDEFRDRDIDGEALLSLTQSDLVTILHMKLGPAVKLYNAIVLLRQRVKVV